MAAKLGDLGNRMSRANPQMEGYADLPSQSAKDLLESEASGSSPFHLPSWSPVRRLPSSCPNMKHCLEIHVTLTEELGVVPSPSHSWMTPLVEDMLHDIRTGLTKAVVIGPGRAVLFYGKCSMGEGLTADKARDAAFLLTRAGMWVGKLAYLATDPMIIQEGWWAIAQAITDHQVKVRGPGHPWINLPAQQPFRFDHLRGSPLKDTSGDGGSNCQPSPCQAPRSQDCNRCQRDQRPPLPQFPSPSLDHGFESDRSSLSMASSMLSRSDGSDGSWHSRWGRQHWEDGAHMKINFSVFKDEDAKDVVTYQSWRWDLMVYWHVGCRDCTCLPYAIQSLQGYPGELVQSSGVDITLDDVLKILDEHCNNLKALDARNQELFQLWMADIRNCIRLGCLSFETSPGFGCFLSWLLSPWLSGRVEERPLLWWAPQVTESNGSLPEGKSAGKNLFRLPKGHPRSQEGRLHGVAPGSQDSGNQYSSQTKGYQFLPPEATQGQPSPSQKGLLCIWCIWKKRIPVVMKTKRVMILLELKELQKSLWYAWQGP